MLGDLNCPNIDWENYITQSRDENVFLSFVNENSLYQFVKSPTRASNILDICLSTELNIVDVCVHETFSSSDHCYFTGNLLLKIEENTDSIIKMYSKGDWETVRMFLACHDWNDLFSGLSCSEMWDIFKNVVEYTTENFVPKKVIFQKNDNPWFSSFLGGLVQRKKSKWRNLGPNPSRRKKRDYNNYCKFVKKELKLAKARYEKSTFLDQNFAPKRFYSYMSSINNSKHDGGIPPLQPPNEETCISSYAKTRALANQFKSVFTIDNGIYPPCPQVCPVFHHSFSTINITSHDVVLAIRSLNQNGSPGLDGISPYYIKQVSCYLIYPLQKIFQKSIDSGTIPEDWRKAVIVPIPKKSKNPSDPASYRPISLNSAGSKIIEKIIKSYLMSYLTQNDLISPAQHGFLKSRSTTTNLLESLDDWTKAIDLSIPTDVIYLDAAKAFDSVSHQKLIYKLKKIGIGGQILDWLSSFLSERIQCVKVNNSIYEFDCRLRHWTRYNTWPNYVYIVCK